MGSWATRTLCFARDEPLAMSQRLYSRKPEESLARSWR